jgi:hypothetical protein
LAENREALDSGFLVFFDNSCKMGITVSFPLASPQLEISSSKFEMRGTLGKSNFDIHLVIEQWGEK